MAEDRSSRGKPPATSKDYHKAIAYLPERKLQPSPHQKASLHLAKLRGSKETVARNLRDSFDSAASDASESKNTGMIFRIDLPKLSSSRSPGTYRRERAETEHLTKDYLKLMSTDKQRQADPRHTPKITKPTLPQLDKPSVESLSTFKPQPLAAQEQPFERRATKKLDKRLLGQLHQIHSRSLAQAANNNRRHKDTDSYQDDPSFDSNLARKVHRSKLRDISELDLDQERDLFRTKRSILIQHLPAQETTINKHKRPKDSDTLRRQDAASKQTEKPRDKHFHGRSPRLQQSQEKLLVSLDMIPVVGLNKIPAPASNLPEKQPHRGVEMTSVTFRKNTSEQAALVEASPETSKRNIHQPTAPNLPCPELPQTNTKLEFGYFSNPTPNPVRGSNPAVPAKQPAKDSTLTSKPPSAFEPLKLSPCSTSAAAKVCSGIPQTLSSVSSNRSRQPPPSDLAPDEPTPPEPPASSQHPPAEPIPQLLFREGFQGIIDAMQPVEAPETSPMRDSTEPRDSSRPILMFPAHETDSPVPAAAQEAPDEPEQSAGLTKEELPALQADPVSPPKASLETVESVQRENQLNLLPLDGLNAIIQTIQLVIPEKPKRSSKLAIAAQEADQQSHLRDTPAPPADPATTTIARQHTPPDASAGRPPSASSQKPADPLRQSTSNLSLSNSKHKTPRDRGVKPLEQSARSLRSSKKQERFSVRSGAVSKRPKPYGSASQAGLNLESQDKIGRDIRHFHEDRNDSASERIEVLSRLSESEVDFADSQSLFRMDFMEDKKFKGIDPGKADQAAIEEARKLQAGMEGFKRRGQLIQQKPLQLGIGSEQASKRFPNANDPLAKFKATKIGNGPYDFIFHSFDDEDQSCGQLVIGLEDQVVQWEEDRLSQLVRVGPEDPVHYDLPDASLSGRDAHPADSDTEGGEEEQDVDYHTSEEDETSEKKSLQASSYQNASQQPPKASLYLSRLIVYDTAEGIVGFRCYYRKGEDLLRGKLLGCGSASFVEVCLTEVNRLEEVTSELSNHYIKRLRFCTNEGDSFSSGNDLFDYFSRIYSYTIKKKLVSLLTAGFNEAGYLACLSFKLA